MQDYKKTVLTQYASSSKIMAILELFNQNMDITAYIDDFYNKIWNLNTAEGIGLDIWGRIVGISRYLKLDSVASEEAFGFNEATAPGVDYPLPFNDGVFYDSTGNNTPNFAMPDLAFRKLIYIKARYNLSDSSIPNINLILREFIGDQCYIIDNLNMTVTIIITAPASEFELNVLENSPIIPIPSGVQRNIIYIPEFYWGFNEAGDALPFNDGTFYSGA